ncbi:uncharacterized protein LOC110661117 isoform X2 [Hevea brasiliensis]|uniref:uncharacterized protein LOC110661117 isoform X2 n=1 Tax=Hevea brasiliensis TaxID=3981 RepID=UPI0025D3234C|nr:uncharacterized protein LOC110661117 isoform X2 [Hevea brasiliensis]
MISPKQTSEGRGSSHFGHTPLLIIHIIGIFLRIWSVYSMYGNLSQPAALVVPPSIINGAITALYFILWGKGLKSCGPVRRAHCNVGIFLLLISRTEDCTEEVLSMTEMIVPILAGIFSALRRAIAWRVSLKNQLKRRLHAITITAATCFLFPVAMWDFIIGSTSDNKIALPFSAWAFLGTILFGVILIFYVDSIAEERLHMVFSSPRHLMIAGGCIIIMEIVYKMDFSLLGFIIYSLILGIGPMFFWRKWGCAGNSV